MSQLSKRNLIYIIFHMNTKELKMTDIEYKPRSPGKNVTVFLNGDVNDDLVRSAKAGKRSKTKELILRVKHHLELFPELPPEALPDTY
ncbi:TraY domain-containing protein [Lelliottia nimipressuralis]|uniref:Relaxosome protein TraY n=2 Tax=Lelliottia nimipressuralis TaxID=69220 RepID=A0ABY3NX75_9ENTR|nr:TraY domain-containing protein [Lelliottia nimipressuralis]TYT29231.1 TraY domain-containing protein [Lelliottia nimipressuralis]